MFRATSPWAWRRASAFMILAALIAVAPATLAGQGITPEQVVGMERVSSVALSPDGRLIAYTLVKPRGAEDEPGRAYSELWVVPAAGGEARAVVQAPNSARAPMWSPDGNTLAFTARLDAHAQTQVYGVPAAGGEPRLLTRSPVSIGSFAWSPDGDAIAYTARVAEPEDWVARRERGFDAKVAGEGERHVRLWLETPGGGDRRAVTPDDLTVRSFSWKPDGSGFAVQVTESTLTDASYMFRQLYTASVDGGVLQPLAPTRGKLGDMAWSPDGERLAFIGAVSMNDPLAQSVFVVVEAGGEAVNRTPGYEGTVQALGWLDDGSIWFVAAEGALTELNRVDAERGEIRRIAGGGAEIFHGISLDARGRAFATAAHTAAHPAEVYTGAARGGALSRVTRHNPWLDEVQLAEQEIIQWTGPDGLTIEGVLVHPLDERAGVRYPLAVTPHGGPEGISYNGWTTSALYPAQVLAANGYAVLMPNYRGSGGRGVAFAKGDHRDLGGEEFDDVIAGIEHLGQQGLVDTDRVGISGTSYGGYFSAWGATRHTDRFQAAVVFAGLTNWISFTGTTDIPYEMSLVHWDEWWFENQGEHWDRSPLRWINQAATPTLVAHGLADERVHPEQSLELYTALRIKGVPTGLVLYPREPHGLLERAHQLDFMGRLLEWFDTYLKDGVPATD